MRQQKLVCTSVAASQHHHGRWVVIYYNRNKEEESQENSKNRKLKLNTRRITEIDYFATLLLLLASF